MTNNKTVYVGMSLTQAPEEFRGEFQESLKNLLRESGYSVLDFVGLEAGTDSEVYQHDIKQTLSADLCLFVVDHPSIGLGMEMAYRHHEGGGLIICARQGVKISRMITGFAKEENVLFLRYDTPNDILDYVNLHFRMKDINL